MGEHAAAHRVDDVGKFVLPIGPCQLFAINGKAVVIRREYMQVSHQVRMFLCTFLETLRQGLEERALERVLLLVICVFSWGERKLCRDHSQSHSFSVLRRADATNSCLRSGDGNDSYSRPGFHSEANDIVCGLARPADLADFQDIYQLIADLLDAQV